MVRWLALILMFPVAAQAQTGTDGEIYDWSFWYGQESLGVAWSTRMLQDGSTLLQVAMASAYELPAGNGAPAHFGMMNSWKYECSESRYMPVHTRYYDATGEQSGETPGRAEYLPFSEAGEDEALLRAVCGGPPVPDHENWRGSAEDTLRRLGDIVEEQYHAIYCVALLTLAIERQPQFPDFIDHRARTLAYYAARSGGVGGEAEEVAALLTALVEGEVDQGSVDLQTELDNCTFVFGSLDNLNASAPTAAIAAPTLAPAAPPAIIDLGDRFEMLEAHHQPAEGRWGVVFTRQPGTNFYEGVWTDQRTGARGVETVEVAGIQNGEFVIRRGGGVYTFPVGADGRPGVGDASWAANPTFYAELYINGASAPEPAPLTFWDFGPEIRMDEVSPSRGHRWQWTWTRRADTNVYDGIYTEQSTGERGTDVMEVLGVEGGRLLLWRRSGPGAYYHFPVEGGALGRGTASWVSDADFYVEVLN